MQARWGTHGDHPVICYYPSSVKEMYEYTLKAFNMAEKFRTPVLVMTDEVIAHMREGVSINDDVEVIDRKKPEWGVPYFPFKATNGEEIAPLAPFGSGFRFHVTGLAHDEMGYPSNSPVKNDEMIRHICAKVDKRADEIVESVEYYTEDAEVLFVACGSVARTALYAIKQMRKEGVKAGLLVPKTVWPFPEKALKALSSRINKIIVPEMNMGQLVYEVERIVKNDSEVILLEKVTGELFKTEEIYKKAMAVIRHE
jgi:2-oxoglutarate ferredoxin oxidoreductase subunit alpha